MPPTLKRNNFTAVPLLTAILNITSWTEIGQETLKVGENVSQFPTHYAEKPRDPKMPRSRKKTRIDYLSLSICIRVSTA